MCLQTFTQFTQLPYEIRKEIWLHAMIPATVYARPTGREGRPRKQANPVLLQVCRESRASALARYELVSDIDKTYVSFDLDTIYIDFDPSFTLFDDPFSPSENEARFRYLTIDYDWLKFGINNLVEKVSRCQSLRQLTVVFGFTTTIDREHTADLSTYLAIYKDMTADELLASLLDDDYRKEFASFDDLCKEFSIFWLWLVRDKFPHRETWPEIFIVTKPAISRNRRGWEELLLGLSLDGNG